LQIKTINRRLHVPTQTRRFITSQKQSFIGEGPERRLEGLWFVEEIWPNSTVFVIGGGPSIASMQLGLLMGQYVVGVNSAFHLDIPVAVTFFGDSRWLIWEYDSLCQKQYAGILVTCQAKLKNPDDLPIKRLAKSKKTQGITEKRYEISWNNSSGGAAINLAYHLGARRIVLIGYDMGINNGRHNFHDSYPVGKPERNPYRHFLKSFDRIKDDADKLGVEILNATPNSNLNVFPKVRLEDICC